MNWLTAIFGLLGLYGLAGLLYTFAKADGPAEAGAVEFWGTVVVLCAIAAGINEWRARRRATRIRRSTGDGGAQP